MKTRALSRTVALAACAAALLTALRPASAADVNKSCALLTPVELLVVFGETVSLAPEGVTAEFSTCSGETSKGTVRLRLATRHADTGDADKRRVERTRKLGAKVDVKTFGAMTCSTVVPPESFANHGYSTTCSIIKGSVLAAVDVTAKALKDLVPIERLQPLAEKMLDRF